MTTEKLELSHICPYLPYELIGIFTDLPGAKPFTITGITITDDEDYEISIHGVPGVYGGHTSLLTNFKPLLIPLGELTEEQWIEVFKAGDDDHLGELNSFKFSNNLSAVIFCFDRTECWFSFKNLQFETSPVKFNQLAAFSKLYEFHADLHGLIEKGLALNKLEVLK